MQEPEKCMYSMHFSGSGSQLEQLWGLEQRISVPRMAGIGDEREPSVPPIMDQRSTMAAAYLFFDAVHADQPTPRYFRAPYF